MIADGNRGEIVMWLLEHCMRQRHADPVNGRYHTQTFFFGDTVRIPAPVDITLDAPTS
ncbi:hypothetical protein [Streptomyces sp. NPDC031705]|uniref:hypothetical protein n=1 Tax=Streptomyces sp. NPDC031705 TaxID=3155729 RepID=UPI0033E636EC